MKKNRILLTAVALLAFSSTANASLEGETIFTAKCSACHSTTRPTDMNKVIAPALMGVMYHIKMEYPNKSEAVAFIKDFVINPTKKKAICMPKKLEKFGLMPSQKGLVSERELEVIAVWMFDNFPPKDFKGMRHGKNKNDNRAKKGSSPFLISALPHLTKTVKKYWDDFDFDLSDEQQDKLTKVRQETMKKVREIKPQLKTLVKKIKNMSDKNEKIEKIIPLVQEVAKLKADATKVQLNCIAKTKELLTKKQLEFLSTK